MDNSIDTDPTEYAMGDYGTKVNLQDNTHQSPSLKKFVLDLVQNNRIVIFSKTQCPHCDVSKSLLSKLGAEYKTIELDELTNGSEVQSTLGEMTSARTVPRIFIDGQCVGGNSDLQILDNNGVLGDILKKSDLTKPQPQ